MKPRPGGEPNKGWQQQKQKTKETNPAQYPMKLLSLNVKGLSDPNKGKKVKSWLKQQDNFDALVLTEIKISGDDLR